MRRRRMSVIEWAMWLTAGFVAAIVAMGCAGPAAGADDGTVRVHRAEVSARLMRMGASVVRAGRVDVVPLVPSDKREAVERAFRTSAEAFDAAALAAQAAAEGAEAESWRASLGCAASALSELLDVLRASGVTTGFSETGRDILTYLDVGFNYVPGGCS